MKSFHLTILSVIRLLFLSILLLTVAGCTTVDVINLSELNARIRIQLPDAPGGYTRLVRPAGSTSTFSTHGGRVTIQTLPDEEYRNLLNELREQITQRLWEERSALSAAEVIALVDRMQDIDAAVDNLADDDTSCTVVAPDFSAVTAILNWDTQQGQWSLICSVAVDESE